MKILIMGLPGSGKTELAKRLNSVLNAKWFNADEIRQKFNDWDFSEEGRQRQAKRMSDLSSEYPIAICDFVAPTEITRQIFNADLTIWMDTISEGRFEDTNRVFEEPSHYDFRITGFTEEKGYNVDRIINVILGKEELPKFDYRKETAQMLGRWQPWHLGHRTLFEEALKKQGQVCIMIRDCQGWNNSNPFDYEQVKKFIRKDLDPLYKGRYEIIVVPNILEIVYGRDVGYKITQIELSKEIQDISATKIRKDMGIE